MLAQPDTQQKLLSMGLEPAGGTAAEFGTLIHSEIAKYRDIVRKAHVTLD
jgi:tripartite-type tricarboxylate transporter receptor subunit TctC